MAITPYHGYNILNDGIEVGEVVGWRVWSLSDLSIRGRRSEDLRLKSPITGTVWLPGEEMTAYDFRDPSFRFPSTCGFGVHAFKNMSQAKAESFFGRVIGSVWLYGEIWEHSDGYRAEYARIRSIDYLGTMRHRKFIRANRFPYSYGNIIWTIRRNYGVGSFSDHINPHGGDE